VQPVEIVKLNSLLLMYIDVKQKIILLLPENFWWDFCNFHNFSNFWEFYIFFKRKKIFTLYFCYGI